MKSRPAAPATRPIHAPRSLIAPPVRRSRSTPLRPPSLLRRALLRLTLQTASGSGLYLGQGGRQEVTLPFGMSDHGGERPWSSARDEDVLLLQPDERVRIDGRRMATRARAWRTCRRSADETPHHRSRLSSTDRHRRIEKRGLCSVNQREDTRGRARYVARDGLRLPRPNLRRRFFLWKATVVGDTNSAWAISPELLPALMRVAISCSR